MYKSIARCNARFATKTVYPCSTMENRAILGTVIRATGDQFDDKHVLQHPPSGLSLLGRRKSPREEQVCSQSSQHQHHCITSSGAGAGKPDQS